MNTLRRILPLLLYLTCILCEYNNNTNHEIMKLEREWIENCMGDHKCPCPGLKSYKLDKRKSGQKSNKHEYEGIDCIDGYNDVDNISYPCKNIKVLSFVTLEDLGSNGVINFEWQPDSIVNGSFGTDLWGYKNVKNNKLYGLTGQFDGTSIVDVTDPTNPIPMAYIPTTNDVPALWRDIKTYKNYMYIVADYGYPVKQVQCQQDADLFNKSSEELAELAELKNVSIDDLNYGVNQLKIDCNYGKSAQNHGLQYFNLDNIENIDETQDNLPIRVPSQDIGLYTDFGECHNLVINEDSGYLYAVGSETCDGGLHIVDINDPGNPIFVTCFSLLGYIHDAQCVTYDNGREYCFNAHIFTQLVSIIDVTDKSNIFIISNFSYTDGLVGPQMTHQMWITPNYQYLLLNDEGDVEKCAEIECENKRTRTYIVDISDLENPIFIGPYFGTEEAVAHNLYIDNNGNYAYLSNYQSGLRVLDISGLYDYDIHNDDADDIIDSVFEIAYFDAFPEDDNPTHILELGGVWSSYIYFDKFILLQSIDRGLFIVEPTFNKPKKEKNDDGFFNLFWFWL